MTNSRCVFHAAAVIIAATLSAAAQDPSKGHWGVQGDLASVNVPQAIIKKIDALPEQPSISGQSFGVGIVRFHPSGAPSYALQYSRLYVTMQGSRQDTTTIRELTGAAAMRGFMATKYVNVITRRYASAGFAFGGGVGTGKAHYARHVQFQGNRFVVEANNYNRTIPLFEILGRIDLRPIRHVSIGPYYGIRNGALAFGVALRLHAIR
jgi:hypothetical protein